MLCVNIFARNQERSLRFYVDQLGFGVVVDESYESGGRWVTPPDGNAVLALVTPKRSFKEYKLIGNCRNVVLVTEDVPPKYKDWRKRSRMNVDLASHVLWTAAYRTRLGFRCGGKRLLL